MREFPSRDSVLLLGGLLAVARLLAGCSTAPEQYVVLRSAESVTAPQRSVETKTIGADGEEWILRAYVASESDAGEWADALPAVASEWRNHLSDLVAEPPFHIADSWDRDWNADGVADLLTGCHDHR